MIRFHSTGLCFSLMLLAMAHGAAIGDQQPVEIADLIQDLQQDDTAKIVAAANALAAQGREASPAIQDLGKLLSHNDADVRAAAADSLGAIGVYDASLDEGLLDMLKDGRLASNRHRLWLCAVLAIGKLQADVVPQLIPMLESQVTHERQGAAIALHGIGADASRRSGLNQAA